MVMLVYCDVWQDLVSILHFYQDIFQERRNENLTKNTFGPDYERCKATVVTKEELSSMTLYELSNMVSKVVGRFFDGEDKLHLQYRDDEGTYVTMNKQSDISDAAQLSSPIPQNDELLRVCLRVDNDFTPTS